jgi:hypothetical protein
LDSEMYAPPDNSCPYKSTCIHSRDIFLPMS